jgi:hypothetical protein
MIVPMGSSGGAVVKMPSQNPVGVKKIIPMSKDSQSGKDLVSEEIDFRIEQDLAMEAALGKQEVERWEGCRNGTRKSTP